MVLSGVCIGTIEYAKREFAERGAAPFWRYNGRVCLRHGPQQGSVLAFNDALNNALPKYDSKTQFWRSIGVKLVSGGIAGAVVNTIVYRTTASLSWDIWISNDTGRTSNDASSAASPTASRRPCAARASPACTPAGP